MMKSWGPPMLPLASAGRGLQEGQKGRRGWVREDRIRTSNEDHRSDRDLLGVTGNVDTDGTESEGDGGDEGGEHVVEGELEADLLAGVLDDESSEGREDAGNHDPAPDVLPSSDGDRGEEGEEDLEKAAGRRIGLESVLDLSGPLAPP